MKRTIKYLQVGRAAENWPDDDSNVPEVDAELDAPKALFDIIQQETGCTDVKELYLQTLGLDDPPTKRWQHVKNVSELPEGKLKLKVVSSPGGGVSAPAAADKFEAGIPNTGQQQDHSPLRSWDVDSKADRVDILSHLYGQYVESAKGRSSLPGDVAGDGEGPTCPGPDYNSPGAAISCIGKSWGRVQRPEVINGTAQVMLRSFGNHCAPWSRIKNRLPIAALFVNWSGGGKTTALRCAPFDALSKMQEHPEEFLGYSSRQGLLKVTCHTRKHRLAFMIDFQQDTTGVSDFVGLTPASIVAWCLLFSMIRSAELEHTPKRFRDMLARVREELPGTGQRIVAGKVLRVELFKQQLHIGDVLTLMRRVHDIPDEQHIGVFWAWDEALSVEQEQLQDMCDQFRQEALSPACNKTWLLLTIASSVSRSVQHADPGGTLPSAATPSKLQRYLLVPMHPLYLKDMLWLVDEAWRVIRPERGSRQLHDTVRYWVALVEGNPRLLECLLAAASGSDDWTKVNCEQLDNFLSKGVTSAPAATSLIKRLVKLVKQSGVLTKDALATACTADGSKWLLNLLGRCLLGTVVKGDDNMTGLQLSYSKGQDMGVFSLKLVADGSSSKLEDPESNSSNSELQDPEYVHGTVHLPAIIVYQLYKQALDSEQFSHHKPLLHHWTAQLPRLLIQSKTREYIDPGAAALRLDFLRVTEDKKVVTLGEVLPLKGAAKDKFAHYRVETDHDWTPITSQSQQLKQDAAYPAAPPVSVGQGTAAEADLLMRLKLADEDGHLILWFQSKFHKAYGDGKEPASLLEEYNKALAADVRADRQLFVLCTDAREMSLKGLQVNTVVLCADQHAAFYSSAGVLFRELVSQVVRSTERRSLHVAAGRAQRPDATPKDLDNYKSQMARMNKKRLVEYAHEQGITDVAEKPKAAIAKRICEHTKRQRSQ